MINPNSEISILDIPHIVNGIGQYLHRRHIFYCILVSKAWNTAFIPLLWRKIDFQWNIAEEYLLRYQQYILSIASIEDFLTKTSANVTVSNLRNILPTVRDYVDIKKYDGRFLQRLPHLFTHTVFLQSLVLTVPESSSEELVHNLPFQLQYLSCLKAITLTLELPTKLELVYHVIDSCKRCQVFYLAVNLKNQESVSIEQVEDFKASLGAVTDIKFRDLKIRMLSEKFEIDIVVPLLKRSPLVESFYLFRPYSLDTLNEISCILQDSGRSPIMSLGIEEDPSLEQPAYWKCMQSLFQTVISKDYIDISIPPNVQFKQSRKSSLLDFRDEQMYIDEAILQNLPLYLSNTLTSLELVRIIFVSFISLLRYLPSLQILSTSVLVSIDVENDIIEDLSKKSWACTGMKKLDLRLAAECPMSIDDDKQIKCLFENIGTLHRLEEWRLSCGARVLTVSGGRYLDGLLDDEDLQALEEIQESLFLMRIGYLDQLSELKELYKLDLTHYYGYTWISVEDVLWMVHNWPRLSHLTVVRDTIPDQMLPAILDIADQNGISVDLKTAGWELQSSPPNIL